MQKDIYYYEKMSDNKLLKELSKVIGIKDSAFIFDLNAINKFVLSKDGPFQCRYVKNIYLIIGHHDHQEIEAVLATSKIRIIALLQTLNNYYSF
jgi:hypothetical protein